MKPAAYAVILAGGFGVRLGPLSSRARPKQFLPLLGRRSLLQQTYQRLARLFPRARIFVVGNRLHRALFRRQLPQLPAANLLLEPVGRNTAAAVALAAAHIRRRDPDAVVAILPADHAIAGEKRFRRAVRAALAAAERKRALVVVGIPPTQPHTGYGYIEGGRAAGRSAGERFFRVQRFTEKPSAAAARRYLKRGCYYWNSGMFFSRLSVLDSLLRRYLPATALAMDLLALTADSAAIQGLLAQLLYPRLENISLDYALAEPAARRGLLRVVPARFPWSDLGSFAALREWKAKT